MRADPALFRDDDGDRLALDHGLLDVLDVAIRRLAEGGAAAAELGVGAVFLLHVARSARRSSATASASEASRPSICFFSSVSAVELLADLDLLELAQGAQAHVEDRLGLDVGQLEAAHQLRLRLVLVADDADDLVDVEIGDQEAAEDFQPPLDLAEPMARAADQHVLAVVQPFLQHVAQRQDVGHPALRQHVHVERNARLEIGQPEQRFHQQVRDRPCGSSARARGGCPRPNSSRTSSSSGSLRARSSSAIFSISRDFCT